MKHYIRVWLLLVGAVGVNAFAAEPPRITTIGAPKAILFIGNSFTYYNNGLQNHLSGLMKSAGREVERLRILTFSGGSLDEHLAGVPAAVALRDWDVVVLQGHSREALDAERIDAFRAAARQHDEAIRQSTARTALFMTWAYEGEPQQTAIIGENYTAAGNELGALVVPVGLAFAEANERFPDIPLRMADARHPTLEGTYLAACTFYAAFFGASPQGLDYRAGLASGTATKLQSAAWRAVRAYYRGHD